MISISNIPGNILLPWYPTQEGLHLEYYMQLLLLYLKASPNKSKEKERTARISSRIFQPGVTNDEEI